MMKWKRFAPLDVDVYGAAVMCALLGAAWMGVIRPLSSSGSEIDTLRRQAAADGTALQQSQLRLQQVRGQALELVRLVNSEVARAPRSEELSQFLMRLSERAMECGLRIEQITPQPARRNGDWNVIDISVTGTGPSGALAELSRRLAETSQYHAFVEYQIAGDPTAEQNTRRIAFTLRLYLVESSGYAPAEVKP